MAGEEQEAHKVHTKVRDALQEMLRQQRDDPFLLSGLVTAEAGLGNEKATFAALDALQSKTSERKDVLVDRATLDQRARLLVAARRPGECGRSPL